MKIYTADFNANQPTLKQIGVPNYSTFKVGIDVEKNGEKVELGTDNVTLKDGNNTISADSVYNGYVTFPLSTGDCGDDKTFTVKCDKGYDWETTISGYNPIPVEVQGLIQSTITIPVGLTLNCYKLWDNLRHARGQIRKGSSMLAQFWRNMTTGEIYWFNESENYGEDYTVNEDGCVLAFTYNFGPQESYSEQLSYGEPFKQNFNLVVNSVKSSVCEEEKELKTDITETTYYKFEPETSADYLTYTSTSGGANLSCVIKGFTIDKTTNQINHLKLDTIGQQGSYQPTVYPYDNDITRNETTYYIIAGEAIAGSIKYDRVNDTLKFGGKTTATDFSKALADKDPVTKFLGVENVDYKTANVIDDSTNKIPNSKAVKDYVDALMAKLKADNELV